MLLQFLLPPAGGAETSEKTKNKKRHSCSERTDERVDAPHSLRVRLMTVSTDGNQNDLIVAGGRRAASSSSSSPRRQTDRQVHLLRPAAGRLGSGSVCCVSADHVDPISDQCRCSARVCVCVCFGKQHGGDDVTVCRCGMFMFDVSGS